jgi:hypothetical protein
MKTNGACNSQCGEEIVQKNLVNGWDKGVSSLIIRIGVVSCKVNGHLHVSAGHKIRLDSIRKHEHSYPSPPWRSFLQTLKSTEAMAKAMAGATKSMAAMNKRMNLPALHQIMKEFEKQNAKMDMVDEMMGDAMDDVFEVLFFFSTHCYKNYQLILLSLFLSTCSDQFFGNKLRKQFVESESVGSVVPLN